MFVKPSIVRIVQLQLLLIIATASHAQHKIGHISFNEIIEVLPEAKKADSILAEFRDALNQASADKQAAFNDGVAKFYKDSISMTTAVKEVKRRALMLQMQDLQGEEERVKEELQKKQEALITPIQKRVQDALQAVSKENGYYFVFVREALLVYPAGDDLSALVKKKLGVK